MNEENVLRRHLTSAKTWTMVVGLIMTFLGPWLAKKGWDVDAERAGEIGQYIAGAFGLLLVGQTVTGAGKEKAVEERKTQVTLAAMANGVAPDEAVEIGKRSASPSKAPPIAQGPSA